MTLRIDFMLMQNAITDIRLPGEPPNQGYLNCRTGEVALVFETAKEALWLGTGAPFENCVHRTRAEIEAANEASPSEWVPIPWRVWEWEPEDELSEEGMRKDPKAHEREMTADVRRKDIEFIQNFLSDNGIDAVLWDVATGETIAAID